MFIWTGQPHTSVVKGGKQGKSRKRTAENEALALLPGAEVQQLHRHPLRSRQEALVRRSSLPCRMRAASRHACTLPCLQH